MEYSTSKQNNELPKIIDSLSIDEAREKFISENAYRIVNENFLNQKNSV